MLTPTSPVSKRGGRGGNPAGVASVASFFVSRIDTAIDAELDARLSKAADGREQRLLQSLRGKVAIANARLAYQRYQELCSGPRWRALAAHGAQPQRLLWASTGTKNASYRDVVYVEELIGPDTVNTIPPPTLAAFRDHGRPRPSLVEDLDGAWDTMACLARRASRLKATTDRLLAEGSELFVDAFGKLLSAVERESRGPGGTDQPPPLQPLPPAIETAVQESLDDWQAQGKVRRLWARDATLWTGRDEALARLARDHRRPARAPAALRRPPRPRRAGRVSDVLLLGMGGSSLCPEVLKMTFGRRPGYPELHVLDSTDPAQVRAFESRIDPATTLFIVSSKSGSTVEPNIFKQYFFERVAEAAGPQGGRPPIHRHHRSRLEAAAGRRDRRLPPRLLGWPAIGGRYSALSDFGLVPAAIMGVDVARFLDRTDEMVSRLHAVVPPTRTPASCSA